MRIKHLDYFLLFIVILVLILGISFLATISAPSSIKRFGTTNYYWIHQLVYGILPGFILGLIAFLIPLTFIRKVSPILLLLNLIALVLIFLPLLGLNFWGASRWLKIGGIVIQPSEFLKITAILYLSSLLRNKLNYQARGIGILKSKKAFHNLKEVFLPFLFFLAIISVIFICQPDISTLGIIGLTMVAIYFVSSMPKWHIALIILIAILSLFILVKFEPYRLSRLTTFLNPETDPLGAGFQSKQALIAVGSGGLSGIGLGMSSQSGFLPQSMSDSTFAVFAEETGFVGCLILIALFIMFLWAGLAIAKHTDDKFGQLVALGITFWILLQGFVNISSMIGIFPLTGIPLPFISYGGSHIISELIGVGLLLNIARHTKY
ncbi:FtsW/RodA/SpoVE family cell cycle protein [Patescibacteria group bacterium]|nr:FtsW/RodA/SpoVE family cell cycle protein [Patescibacteria group bacterium]